MYMLPKVSLGRKYLEYINENIDSLNGFNILLYGSAALNNVNTSDLDVAYIVKDWDENLFQKIKELTIKFQKKYGMRLDEEVPYENKLIYSIDEVENMLKYRMLRRNLC